jgi:hypothetical protein
MREATTVATAESREIIATSKKLLMRSQELQQKMEHQQISIINRTDRAYFIATIFRSFLRN